MSAPTRGNDLSDPLSERGIAARREVRKILTQRLLGAVERFQALQQESLALERRVLALRAHATIAEAHATPKPPEKEKT